MLGIVLNSIMLLRSLLYCIVNLLLGGFNTIQCHTLICRGIGPTLLMRMYASLPFFYKNLRNFENIKKLNPTLEIAKRIYHFV